MGTGKQLFTSVFKEEPDGVCDCGDPDAWDIKGNCCKHSGFIDEDDSLTQPEKDLFVNCLKKGFGLLMMAIEKMDNKTNRHSYFVILIDDMIRRLIFLCEQYTPLIPVIARALYTDCVLQSGNKLTVLHDPELLEGTNERLSEPQECSSSVLQLMFRFNGWMTPKAQSRLVDLFIFLSANYEFKRHLALAYVSYFHFLSPTEVILEENSARNQESKLMNLNDQIMFSSELSFLAFTKANIHSYLFGIQRKLNSCICPTGEIATIYEILIPHIFYNLKVFLRNKQVSAEFFADPTLTDMYFGLFETFERHSYKYDPNFSVTAMKNYYDKLSFLIMHNSRFEQALTTHLIEVNGTLVEHSEETKMAISVNCLRILKKKIMNLVEYEHPSVNKVLERGYILHLLTAVYTRCSR